MKRLLLMIIVFWGVLVQMIAENTLFYDSRQLTCDLITSICQDKDGFIWIGTDYGLNKFNGIQFTHYYNDPKDSTSLERNDLDFSKSLEEKKLLGMKFGVPKEFLAKGLDPEVKDSFMNVLKTLTEQGAIVEFFSVETMEYMIPAYYIIASAEASSNLERFDGVKYGYRAAEYEGLHDMYKKTRTEAFGEEVKRRIMLGSFVLSSGYYDAYYLKALRTKALIKKEFDQAFEKYDVILAPAAPYTAPKIGESLQDPLAMYLGDVYTVAVNLCGLPGITVPCGMDKAGMPIGIQMIGDCFAEKKILRAAAAYEAVRGAFPTPEKGGKKA